MLIAIASSLYWFIAAQQQISFAVTVFATILVVSCPCALGIATPMVISLGIARSAREGILIKGGQHLERLSYVNTVVFDKTGTLTKGTPEVTDVIASQGYSPEKVLQLALSAEIRSEHPIAQAIVKKALEQKIPPIEVSNFRSISGRGVLAMHEQTRIFVGSHNAMSDRVNHTSELMVQRISELESEGKTVVAVFVDDRLAGIIGVADILREDARHVVDKLKASGKRVVLMSGDNERAARAIAGRLGIDKDDVLAQISPETKAQEIRKLQGHGRKAIVMVGDGINDAPALTQADIGIAMGSGTDVAMSAGHVILMKNDLSDVLAALKIGDYSVRKIKQNLAMSFAYNVITISIAAGILYGITNSLILTPSLAALGWVISDSAVFGNSLRVRRFALRRK